MMHNAITQLPLFTVLIGLVAGMLSGALGVGSGILLVPILVIIYGLPQKVAQGTTLAVMTAMALTGAIRYYLNPSIQLSIVTIILLAAGGIIGAIAGSTIAFALPGAVLRKIFAIFIITVGIRMLIK